MYTPQGIIPPVREGYSDGFRRLVEDMLQKESEARPSADDLYTQRLGELLQREHNEEEATEEPLDIAKTRWAWQRAKGSCDCISY